jgi:cytochrome b561
MKLSLKNTSNSYGSVSKTFHWVIAILILVNFLIASTGMELKSEENSTLLGLGKFAWYNVHKSLGIIILFLAVIRLFWYLINIKPTLNASIYIKIAAKTVHYMLYFILIAFPLSGYLMSSFAGYPVSVFGLFTLPNLVGTNTDLARTFNFLHTEVIATIFFVLISAHILGALFHHFVLKDNTLRKMLPFGKISSKK